MATKLTGMINLSKIDKSLIGQTKKGEKCIFVDVVPIKVGQDDYGNTHQITLYNKNTKETIYLGKLKTQEFGKASVSASNAPSNEGGDDLPW